MLLSCHLWGHSKASWKYRGAKEGRYPSRILRWDLLNLQFPQGDDIAVHVVFLTFYLGGIRNKLLRTLTRTLWIWISWYSVSRANNCFFFSLWIFSPDLQFYKQKLSKLMKKLSSDRMANSISQDRHYSLYHGVHRTKYKRIHDTEILWSWEVSQ